MDAMEESSRRLSRTGQIQNEARYGPRPHELMGRLRRPGVINTSGLGLADYKNRRVWQLESKMRAMRVVIGLLDTNHDDAHFYLGRR